jgi:hypothetical protein
MCTLNDSRGCKNTGGFLAAYAAKKLIAIHSGASKLMNKYEP